MVRSTPLRLALAFLALFFVGSLVSNLIALRVIDTELVVSEERRIRDSHARLAALLRDEGETELREAIAAMGRHPADDVDFAVLVSGDGRVLAASPDGAAQLADTVPDGWSTVPAMSVWADPEHELKVWAGTVDDHRLLVGTSSHDRDEVAEVVLGAFGWSSVALLALTIGGAALIASRFRERFEAVATTMRAVADGQLGARVARSRRGDDIDALGGDINEALERLERSVAQVRQASSDIAHDLRTPLGRLRITLERAAEADAANRPVGTHLDEALQECDGMAATFAALLRISRLESGARRGSFEPVDVVGLMERVVGLYEDVAEDAGRGLVPLAADITAGPPIVEGDRALLLQAVANLVENAIQHAPEGTRVACGVRGEADGVVLSVADDGPGVPEAERDRVLRRLYRLDSSRTNPGSGLGLSLVKAIADLHGAELVLEDNEPGLRVLMRLHPPERSRH